LPEQNYKTASSSSFYVSVQKGTTSSHYCSHEFFFGGRILRQAIRSTIGNEPFRSTAVKEECPPPQWFEPWHNYFFKFIFSSYILILIYLRTCLRKKMYFPHKMGKIGPWRSLRILRIFSAKVDFPRFMYCFGRFSALTQNLSASRSQQVHNILKNALIL
jgi:hypothetical protein